MTRRACPGCGEPHEPTRDGYAHRFCFACELAADVAAEYGRDYFAGGERVPYFGQRERMARLRARAESRRSAPA